LKVVIWKQKPTVQVVAAVWYAILDSLGKELAAAILPSTIGQCAKIIYIIYTSKFI